MRLALAVTCNVTEVVCVTPPPVAVMVMVSVPVVACLLALMVMVELPEPGAAIVLGLNDMLMPLPAPEAVRLTLELKPPLTEVVMVSVVEPPCATESDEEAATIVKSPDVAALTVRETVVDCVSPPPVPVMVIG